MVKKSLYAVYGTLRKGHGNHRLLNNEFCTLLGTTKTAPKFKMVSLGGFPGVIPDGGGEQAVTIEVYEVNHPEVEQRLDWLEGYPSFYNKMEIDTEFGKADMYILDEARYGSRPIVESGDWNQFVEQNRRF